MFHAPPGFSCLLAKNQMKFVSFFLSRSSFRLLLFCLQVCDSTARLLPSDGRASVCEFLNLCTVSKRKQRKEIVSVSFFLLLQQRPVAVGHRQQGKRLSSLTFASTFLLYTPLGRRRVTRCTVGIPACIGMYRILSGQYSHPTFAPFAWDLLACACA